MYATASLATAQCKYFEPKSYSTVLVHVKLPADNITLILSTTKHIFTRTQISHPSPLKKKVTISYTKKQTPTSKIPSLHLLSSTRPPRQSTHSAVNIFPTFFCFSFLHLSTNFFASLGNLHVLSHSFNTSGSTQL